MSQRCYGRKRGINPRFQRRVFDAKHATLPTSLSYESYAPGVFDQGQYGTCVANAIAAVQMLYNTKRGHDAIEVSRSAIYSQAKHSFEPDDIADDGLQITDGLLIPKEFGYVKESAFPYPTDPTGQDTGDLLSPVPARDWVTSFDEASYLSVDTQSVDAMLRAMSEHGPLVIGMDFPEGWENIAPDGYCDPKHAGQIAGGHCVYILAYDQAKFGGAFRCRNSWGTEYGANGDFWVPFAALTECPQVWPDEAYTVAFP